jgi:hypothetical protein
MEKQFFSIVVEIKPFSKVLHLLWCLKNLIPFHLKPGL